MSYKKFLITIVILSLLSVSAPQKTHAQYVDVVQATKEMGLDTIAYNIGRMMLKKLTAQTVNWINSGFKGNPGYVTDPNQFFLDIADNTVSQYLTSNPKLNQLCSPFKAQVKLALIKNYLQEDDNYSCTLNTIKNNYDAFIQDFSQGGWDGWFEMTQTSGGNPYSAYFAAQSGLLKSVASKQESQQKELDLSGGFLNQKKCKSGTEITPSDIYKITSDLISRGYTSEEISEIMATYPKVGECDDSSLETVTPGSVINDGLKKALGSGWEQLHAADEINEIITALVSQLIKKVTGGDKGGLRGTSQPSTGGGNSYTSQLSDDPQPDPVDVNSLSLSPTTMKCVTDPDTGEQTCSVVPGTVTGPEWLTPIRVETANLPSPAQCLQQNGNYAGALSDAMQAVLSANPTLASSMNTTTNSYAFLTLVAQNPPAGYNVTDQVLNGNDNPNRGDLLAIWKNGDEKMERYDVISGAGDGNKKLSDAVYTGFTGSIPLNCTASGGGRGCHCEYAPTTPTPTTPVKNPEITSISPTSIMAGSYLTINGKDLTTTIQLFDNSGNRTTEVGQGGGSQVTVRIPTNLTSGYYTVKIYKSADSISNGKQLVIRAKQLPSIPTVPTTSSWTPTQTVNGWWAQVSPNGKYVAYGNWGESWVTDLESTTNPKQTWDLSKPAGLPAGARCMGGQWITPSTLTFVCEIDQNNSSAGFYRYETEINSGTTKKNETPGLVSANSWVAVDGHYTSYLASDGGRIAQDNKLVVSGAGGAMSVSQDKIVHACDNTNAEICVRKNDGTFLKKYTAKTSLHGTATKNDHIAYGGYGPVRGITPTGTDIDLTVTPWRLEGIGPGGIFYVGTTPWVVTTTWDDYTGNGFVILRPWADNRAIAVVADAVGVSIGIRGNDFVIAYWSDVGKMYVVTVPISSPRSSLD